MEKFRPIVGYEECYEVSNLGRIKSKERIRNAGTKSKRTVRERILKPCAPRKKDLYLSVCLYSNRTKALKKIHRLVASAWIPNPLKKLTVNHKNSNKLDNRVENLEWATLKENIHDYIAKNGNAHLKKRA